MTASHISGFASFSSVDIGQTGQISSLICPVCPMSFLLKFQLKPSNGIVRMACVLELAQSHIQYHHDGETYHDPHGRKIGIIVRLCFRDQFLSHDKDHCTCRKAKGEGQYRPDTKNKQGTKDARYGFDDSRSLSIKTWFLTCLLF